MVNVFMLACPSCLFINYAASAIYWLKMVLWGKVFKQLKSPKPKGSYFAYVHWLAYTFAFSLVGFLVGFCFSWCLCCFLSMKTICKVKKLEVHSFTKHFKNYNTWLARTKTFYFILQCDLTVLLIKEFLPMP